MLDSSRMSRLWRSVAFCVSALVAAGCGGSTVTASDAPAPALVAHASQTRPDAAAGGRFQVVVENTGTLPFTVRSVQLVSPAYAKGPPAEADSDFEPGHRVSLPAPFGAVRCAASAKGAQVALSLVVQGEQQTRNYPLRSDNGLLERIHAKECAALALAKKVNLELDDELLLDGAQAEPALNGVLTVTRRSADGAVKVSGTRGSVLYNVTLPGGLATLALADKYLTVPIRFTARTCDGHAIGEAKQPYNFLAYVAVGTSPEGSALIKTTAAQQAKLLSFLEEACAR